MNLFKTILLTGTSTFFRMISSLIINKIVANILGPSGMSIIGNYQNLISISSTFGNGGILSGVTKYISENNNSISTQKRYINASMSIISFFTIITSVFIIFNTHLIDNVLFPQLNMKFVLIVLGVTLIFTTLNSLIISIINGYKMIKLMTYLNILCSIINLIISIYFTYILGIVGILLAQSIVQVVYFFISLFIIKKNNSNFSLKGYKLFFDRCIYKNLLKYSIMSIATLFSASITQIIIRQIIINYTSLTDAGYWDAINRLSAMILMVSTTALNAYFLPRISEIDKVSECRKEIKSGFLLIMPIVFILFFIGYLTRDLIINILYSSDFYSMRDLFVFQFMGDFFKISSWIISVIFVAKGDVRTFTILELTSSIFYILITLLFVPKIGIIGSVLAYFVMYLCYFFVVIFFYKFRMKKYFSL
ncbi:O-antigen translocase [Turicibacter sanguinis]|uniref:O-antigen translocase n=1 Tax=Turicibacter sanguinis TaxID=154288 RepID=UPI00232DE46D|nr:O-antigen translocase [Turicibacter sanguinis]MDB8542308.1 O-antigen translocase [Turicibacter sanguinis]